MNDQRTLSPFTEDAARLGRALSELTEHNASLIDQLAAMDRAYHIAAAENELLRLALSEANRKSDFNMRYATSLHTQLTSLSNDAILIASRVRDLLEAAKTAAYTPQPTPQLKPPDEVGSANTQIGDDGKPIPKFLTQLEDALRTAQTETATLTSEPTP